MDRRAALWGTLLLVVALVPLIGFAVVTTFISLEAKRTAFEREALAHTHRISALVDAELAAQLGTIMTLARSPALDEPPDIARFAEIMRREQAAQPLWLVGLLADLNGNLLVDTQLPLPGRVHDMASLRQVVESRRPVIGNITRGTVSTGLPLRAPVIHDGIVRWIVTAVIRPDGIRDRLLTAGLPSEWTGAVVDGAGRVVARTGGDPDLIGNPASPGALAARTQGQSGLYAGRLLEGTPTLSAFKVSPHTGWSVHIGIPRVVFDAPLTRARWLAALGGTASLALAGLFLSLLMREVRLRRNADEAREQARRLEGLGRLTGGVAHDFNNLLMVILASVEMLETRVTDSKASQLLQGIRRAAERGAEITRSLSVFSRSGSGVQTVVDVNACLLETVGMLRETAGHGFEVELDLQENLRAVALDRLEFDLSLLNLASNARDAMPEGGTLRIISRPAMLPDGRCAVAVTVADTGAGFSPEVQRRAFEPFFTTKKMGEGTGLGLAQVYGFARSTGGDVRIDSRPGEGARVTLLLPASSASPATAMAPVLEALAAPVTARTLLVVDDNVEVRGVTATYLRECGYRVEEADNAAGALDKLGAGGIDAVVSDVVMPGVLDGFGLAREARCRWPEVPVLLVSGYATTLNEARTAGIPILAKPFALPALAKTVSGLLTGGVQQAAER